MFFVVVQDLEFLTKTEIMHYKFKSLKKTIETWEAVSVGRL